MFRILCQEERISSPDDETTYWVTTNEVTSEDKEVIAAFLRALANKIDPPKPAYRSNPEIPKRYRG